MKVAAITITFNRLELTKRMIESFYLKTNVDYHLFVDNGSTDGTQEFIKQFDHIQLDRNYGIAYAFAVGVNAIEGYDYVLKLDNDIEVVTDDIIFKMLTFLQSVRDRFVISPTDLLLDKNFAPRSSGKERLNGFNIEFVTHTGGAFQMMSYEAAKLLVRQYHALAHGDMAIGQFFKSRGYKTIYLRDLEMKHVGLNQSTPKEVYIM
jgi:GT2 family glycosyltransferase